VISALRMQSVEIDENGINEYFKKLGVGKDGKKKLDFEEFKKILTT
jgi:hypothetical protein